MKIVAVTSCIQGLVHTYMAASALKKAGKKQNVEVKVETQGSIGIEDRLTKEDIAAADLVIFACEVAVREKERFKGKKAIKIRSNDAINKADAVIKKAVSIVEEG